MRMFLNKDIFLVVFFSFITSSLYSQTYSISGRIIECKSKKGISAINLGVLNSQRGAISSESGEFIIEGLNQGSYKLLVSGIGYESEEVTIQVKENTQPVTIALCTKTFDLNEVVITATRTERLLKNVPIQTQIVSSRTIEKMQISNFRNLLEYELPGVDFTNNGGFANINMLGFGGKYVLFLVDGERMAGETFDNIDYNRIDMDNIQQVEIVKGASSSLYGSNAVGGVINIITQRPKLPLEMNANTRFGSNNEQNYSYSIGSRKKWGYANLTTSFKSMDPYLLKDTDPLTQEFNNGQQIEQPLGETYIAGYKDYNIKPRIGIDLTERFFVELKGGYYFKERHPGGLDGSKVRDRYYNYSGGIKADYKITSKQRISFSGNYDRYDKFDFYRLLKEKEKNYENGQWRFGVIHDLQIADKHSIVSGIEYFSDDLMTFMFQSDGSSAKRDAQTYSAFTQQEWLLSDKVTFVTGLRYDYHSQFKGHFTPRVSAMYKPNTYITLRGGYAGGFRSPTLKELYTDWFHPYGGGFQIIGNKEMKAEKSNNFNLSAEAILGKTVITVMGQYSFIDDMVSTLWVNSDTVQYVNIGNSQIFSTETTVSHQIGNTIAIKGSYVYVHNNLGKKSVIRPHTATARIDYSPVVFKKYNPIFSFSGKYFSGMNTYGTGDITDTDNETGIEKEITEEYRIRYDGYSVWRFTLAQALPFNLSLNAGINNLFDYKPKFSSFYSSISPGRTFYIGLKWKLK